MVRSARYLEKLRARAAIPGSASAGSGAGGGLYSSQVASYTSSLVTWKAVGRDEFGGGRMSIMIPPTDMIYWKMILPRAEGAGAADPVVVRIEKMNFLSIRPTIRNQSFASN